ncbi:MAG TPA: DUF6152 family protein [Longimicrobium sp.]|nr:DUF6152 family protein [Longimicrobium sp.]
MDFAANPPRRRLAARLGLVAIALGCGLPPAVAHHGWGGYGTEEFSLSGTVQSANLGGPHGLVRVRDNGGRVWDVVLGPPGHQRRAGLTEDALPAGVAVTAYGHRHLDPNRLEMKTERLVVAGRAFDIYPDRS